MNLLTQDDALQQIRNAIALVGLDEWCRRLSISKQHVNEVLKRRAFPSERFGFEKVVLFRPVTPHVPPIDEKRKRQRKRLANQAVAKKAEAMLKRKKKA